MNFLKLSHIHATPFAIDSGLTFWRRLRSRQVIWISRCAINIVYR
jgi:hypothetical protein